MEASSNHWSLYILRCADGSLYTGITCDLDRRLKQHNAGEGAKYTRGRGPVELAYSEYCGDRSSASRREYRVKRLSSKEKWRLIRAAGRIGESAIPGQATP